MILQHTCAVLLAAFPVGYIGANMRNPQEQSVTFKLAQYSNVSPSQTGMSNTPSEVDDASNKSTETLNNPLWAIPIEKLSITREHPLFSASRRPDPPVVAPPDPVAKQTAAESPQFTLVGTIVSSSEQSAVFVLDSSKSTFRVKTGDSIMGWTLRAVDTRSVVVGKGTAYVTLALPGPGAGSSGVLPAPNAQPALFPSLQERHPTPEIPPEASLPK
jgi:hypothetical protein